MDVQPNENGKFSITDKVPILGIFNPEVTYSCETVQTPDGVDVVTSAPLGVTIKDTWRVVAGAEEGTSLVTEDVEITANALVLPTVTGNLERRVLLGWTFARREPTGWYDIAS